MAARLFRVILTAFLLVPYFGLQPAGESNPTLVADINTHTSDGILPDYWMQDGTQSYFFAEYIDGSANRRLQLWMTGGTPQTTRFLRSFQAEGSYQGYPPLVSRFAVLNSYVYFAADDGVHGMELWRTDGTADGTQMVLDRAEGWAPSSPYSLVALDGVLFFISGNNVLRLNPETGATLEVGWVDAEPGILVAFDHAVFFAARTQAGDLELFRSDGTPQGTALYSDLCPGNCSSRPRLYGVFGGRLYFTANDNTHGDELWSLSPTPPGGAPPQPVLLADILPGINSSYPTVPQALGDQVLFTASEMSAGRELYITDGTPQGTRLLADLIPGQQPSEPILLHPLPGQNGTPEMLFVTNGGGIAPDLWKTNGTPEGTQKVVALPALKNPGDYARSAKAGLAGDKLLFSVYNAQNGQELWVSDGTGPGTHLLLDLWPGPFSSYPMHFFPCPGGTCFFADDGDHGSELWRSDGTPEGTLLLADANQTRPSSTPRDFVASGGLLYFTADDGTHGRGLWRTDGTSQSTLLLHPGHMDEDLTAYREMSAASGGLYFTAYDEPHGIELWFSDGTPEGTALVKDIYPGVQESKPKQLTAAGDAVFFLAEDPLHGFELWTAGGSPVTARLVKDIVPGAAGLVSPELAAFGDQALLFEYISSQVSTRLWKSDGSAEGTQVFTTLSGFTYGQPAQVGGMLYFELQKPEYGTGAIWQTDGSAAGTRAIALPEGYTVEGAPMLAGEKVFYLALGPRGTALLVTDGGGGSVVVKDFGSREYYSKPGMSADIHGRLVMLMDTSNESRYWTSDGTPAGTFEIGGEYEYPGLPFVIGPFLVFSAMEPGSYTRQLWLWDGRSSSARRVPGIDLELYLNGSENEMRYFNDRLYFCANDGQLGGELWAFEPGRFKFRLPVISR